MVWNLCNMWVWRRWKVLFRTEAQISLNRRETWSRTIARWKMQVTMFWCKCPFPQTKTSWASFGPSCRHFPPLRSLSISAFRMNIRYAGPCKSDVAWARIKPTISSYEAQSRPLCHGFLPTSQAQILVSLHLGIGKTLGKFLATKPGRARL